MSTSIQEQDLIQKIKELEQRLADIERQQRTIGGWTITPSSIQTGAYNTNGTRYLGDDGLSVSNTFRVDPSGNMTATSATITGGITATSGDISGVLTIGGDNNVKIDGTNDRIVISDGTNDRVLIGNI
jgi:type II secretory pathway pseudopilin PulG